MVANRGLIATPSTLKSLGSGFFDLSFSGIWGIVETEGFFSFFFFGFGFVLVFLRFDQFAEKPGGQYIPPRYTNEGIVPGYVNR